VFDDELCLGFWGLGVWGWWFHACKNQSNSRYTTLQICDINLNFYQQTDDYDEVHL
jgi:hypothetical protein